ncbi:ABC transporter permease [Sporanaerobium hydrogeniformans]|uniref:ABC transporter permease n=1 Tax=Sporanaerobium hydrogeniformans TaxID=3072179 RepID=A0AC61DCW1_9FIRM|nr:ABC transporter permease [Sporanaerobium hydrogeniformans]PHV70603.1 ABC transporter permease [Sporanaerobium hydrogeniformans]
MLGKLLKYEAKATARTFIPIYIALLIVSAINRVFRMNNIEMGFTLSVLVIVGLFIALGVITLIMIIQRFSKNLLSDEGYLMFTLPVKISDLILSKLIISFLWTVISGIVAILAILILLGDATFFSQIKELITVANWNYFLEGIRQEFGGNPIFFIVEVPIISLCMYINTVLMIYLSISVGQLPIFNKHRVLFSFITYFIITTVGQWAIMIIGNIIDYSGFSISSNMGLNLITIGCIAVDIALFMIINFILKKHLNLE